MGGIRGVVVSGRIGSLLFEKGVMGGYGLFLGRREPGDENREM